MKEIQSTRELLEAVQNSEKGDTIIFYQGPAGLGKSSLEYRMARLIDRLARKKGIDMEWR